MRRVAAVVALATAFGFGVGPGSAQDGKPEATIAALQTRVAELETQVAAGSAGQTTPAPTPQPRAVPADTQPVTLLPGIDLLYYYFVPGDHGDHRVLGEVRNTTDHPIDGPTLQFTLLDAGGNILEATRANTLFVVIPPSEAMPFSGGTDLAPGEWADETVRVCGDSVSDSFATDPAYSAEGLELRDVVEEVKEDDALRVTGVVLNYSAEPAEGVWVRAAIFDTEGRFAGDVSAGIEVPIPSGKSARFAVDQGVERLSSADPFDVSGSGWTYDLAVSRDANVRVSFC